MITVAHQDTTADETVTNVGGAGSPVKLYGLHVVNGDNAVRYLQLFDDVAANVTLGTTVPDLSIPLQASASGPQDIELHGLYFPTACSYAITTTATGSTGPTADAHLLILHS